MNLKVKQKIPLKIKRMGINGEGIGFYQKTLVFVPGALKGEDIYCQITSIRRNFVEAKLLKVNKKSKFRIVPSCTIYNECGGCQIMHLHYDKQLEFKTDLLHQALKKFAPAGYENYEIRPTIGMQEPKYYRAKLQFQTRKFKNQVKAGLYAQNSHCTGLDDKLLDTILTYVPEKMVYISCNVSTLARDLVRLVEVYDLHYIQSVDMFPHTARTEAVVKLIKKV
ncbi:RNA methyltransferase [Streptococcus pneumoniae]|nr:RNA methyltransferase [Streptococcus pneumoniae]